ncbi:hypothetical protein B0H14DRAFT_2634299 [Mycena olivaceomarginata]|nr:hypothetical protein B0H14DRAFT_2634299 [Mycena olivaceomarginata]
MACHSCPSAEVPPASKIEYRILHDVIMPRFLKTPITGCPHSSSSTHSRTGVSHASLFSPPCPPPTPTTSPLFTDDERTSDTSGTPRPDSPTLAPRYDFSYYEFERKEKAPSFKPHAFLDRALFHRLDARWPNSLCEWAFFPFPPSEIIPAYALDKSPPRAATTADSPTKDQINNAPHLSKIARPQKPASDVAASPPPGNASAPKPATAKKHKSKPQ